MQKLREATIKKAIATCRNSAFILAADMPSLFFPVARWSVCGAVGQTHSLPSFVCSVGLWGLAMCVAVKRWHLI